MSTISSARSTGDGDLRDMHRCCPGLLLLVLAGAACARPPLELPGGPSTPLAIPAPLLAEALPHCAGIESVTAELGLSGRVGDQKLRGRLLAGFARPAAIRLEGLAPFGAPVFILAGQDGRATLLMPRDDRVLPMADPAAILEALAGVSVPAGDLRAWLTGCPGERGEPSSARQYGTDWASIETGGQQLWLRRRQGAWRLAALERDGLIVEFHGEGAVQPVRLRIRRDADAGRVPVDLSLEIAGVEKNVDLEPAAFAVDVPADAVEISLEELRQSGPLRDVSEPGPRKTSGGQASSS